MDKMTPPDSLYPSQSLLSESDTQVANPVTPGNTDTGRTVTATDVTKKMPQNEGIDSHQEQTTSLSERKMDGIATAEDFQAAIDQRKYFENISEQIDAIPAFKENHPSDLVSRSTGLILAAFNSIHILSADDNKEPYAYYGVIGSSGDKPLIGYTRNKPLAEGDMPSSAKLYLEGAFKNIETMKNLDTRLQDFTNVDIALSLATPKNREILKPHIEKVFTEEKNKLNKS